MSPPQIRDFPTQMLAVTLAIVGFFSSGCAGFASFDAKDSLPLPATLVEIRSAIEDERARLKDLVGNTAIRSDAFDFGSDVRNDREAKTLIAVAERLSRLHAALEQLEQDAASKPPAP